MAIVWCNGRFDCCRGLRVFVACDPDQRWRLFRRFLDVLLFRFHYGSHWHIWLLANLYPRDLARPTGGREGGSVIFAEATGHLPGLTGRFNPIRDLDDRTDLYASNIAIDEGKQQPVHFVPGEELRLIDAEGAERRVRIIDIVGRRSSSTPALPRGAMPDGVLDPVEDLSITEAGKGDLTGLPATASSADKRLFTNPMGHFCLLW